MNAANKKHFFDGNGPGHHLLSYDNKPLFSSFTANGYFINAPLGKNLNPWENNKSTMSLKQFKIKDQTGANSKEQSRMNNIHDE
jgi:hypothetical protein